MGMKVLQLQTNYNFYQSVHLVNIVLKNIEVRCNKETNLRNAWSVWFCILLEHTEPCSNIFNLRKCQTLQKWKYKISLCKVFLWCLRWLLFWLFCTHHPSSHICIKCDCRPLPPSALRSGASHLLIHSHGHHEVILVFCILSSVSGAIYAMAAIDFG